VKHDWIHELESEPEKLQHFNFQMHFSEGDYKKTLVLEGFSQHPFYKPLETSRNLYSPYSVLLQAFWRQLCSHVERSEASPRCGNRLCKLSYCIVLGTGHTKFWWKPVKRLVKFSKTHHSQAFRILAPSHETRWNKCARECTWNPWNAKRRLFWCAYRRGTESLVAMHTIADRRECKKESQPSHFHLHIIVFWKNSAELIETHFGWIELVWASLNSLSSAQDTIVVLVRNCGKTSRGPFLCKGTAWRNSLRPCHPLRSLGDSSAHSAQPECSKCL